MEMRQPPILKRLRVAPGMAHSHSAGEGRLRKLIVRFLSAYAEGETERPPPNHPYLNDCKGTERDHHNRRRQREIEGDRERDHHPATLTLTIEGDRERPPPSHPYLNDRRRQRERDHHPATLTCRRLSCRRGIALHRGNLNF